MEEIKRGQFWYCDFGKASGSEQGGFRPCIVLQNDVGNAHSHTTIVAPLTTSKTKAVLPTHVAVSKGEGDLPYDSTILCEQVRVVNKSRLVSYIGKAGESFMHKVNIAAKVAIGVW